MFKLLTRNEFRDQVFARDGQVCVVCGAPGQDAHHVLERRLWSNGGYYLENGVTLCGECHKLAEATHIPCEQVRERAGITRFPIPDHLDEGQVYDKWGNPILPNGTRMQGELYLDESVQAILSPFRHLFVPWVKYPRTYHLPWSPGATEDDKTLGDTSHFEGKEVVVSVKMDGEQTTMYSDHIHARSVDSKGHPSRNWVKALHGKVCYDIPHRWRVCGENLYAQHSIHYAHLPEYFLAFSVWNEKNSCLSWDETLEWLALLGLVPVPTLYRGLWNETLIRGLYQERFNEDPMEGYVVRLADSFGYRDFSRSVAKFVRKHHVQTQNHWMHSQVSPNLRQQDNHVVFIDGEEPELDMEP